MAERSEQCPTQASAAPAQIALEDFIEAVLRRAADRDEAPPDVEGFAWAVSFNPFTYLDAIELDPPTERETCGRGAKHG
jgi:hypothetical protein